MNFTAAPRGSNDYGNPLGSFTFVRPGFSTIAGAIGACSWSQELHRGALAVNLEGIGVRRYHRKFRPDESGVFTGYKSTNTNSSDGPNGPFQFYGTFTKMPTPP